jgi:hypothetical protein
MLVYNLKNGSWNRSGDRLSSWENCLSNNEEQAMSGNSRELWWALVGIFLITALYALVVLLTGVIPAAKELFGHSLGILGFILMILTETLYSLRKRSRSVRWGRMSEWLKFHIFTGLVGPYMVLLHTSWKFNGVAGVVTLLTILVVLSGIIGRYIYTAIPRSVDGVELESAELGRQIAEADLKLKEWLAAKPQVSQSIQQRLATLPDVSNSGFLAIFGRAMIERDYRQAWKREMKNMGAQERAQIIEIEKMAERRDFIRQQVASLAMARRLLALWHTIHIPVGMVLFTTSFAHIAGALYYASFLK